MPLEEPDELVAALRRENADLAHRLAVAERGMEYFRLELITVVTSVSWRITHPVRRGLAWVRRSRRRVRQVPDRVRARGGSSAPITGLFPPDTTDLPSWVDAPVLERLLPAETPLRVRTAPAPRARVLVVAHVYYADVWMDISQRLTRMPEAFDLVVTLVEGQSEAVAAQVSGDFPDANVLYVENRGRDIWPLVQLANGGWFEGYEAVLKVHTKRSPHRVDGDAWRLSMLDGLLSGPESIARILQLLRKDHSVGVICPQKSISGVEFWGSNEAVVEALAARLPVAFDIDRLRYPAGSMYWANPFLLHRLADLGLEREDFAPEAGQLDATTAHGIERFLGVMASAAGLDLVEVNDVTWRLKAAQRPSAPKPRVLAFYLPQFHAIPENDEWWGDGFTEWTNVRRAVPLFEGHRHPVVPGELGYYDLSDPKVLQSQALLAQEYGVDGFVMYHYWFDGPRLLRKPLDNLLADPSIELPFALCWANENWTRTWDGLEQDVLMAQTYSEGWAERFYDDLLPGLRDPRYLRVNGKPLLIVYRAGQIPDARAVFEKWKARADSDGLGGLHLLGVIPSREFESVEASAAAALDGLVRFPPGSGVGLQQLHPADYEQGPNGAIYSYEAAVEHADLSTRSALGLRIHPGVMPGWDNTARRGEAAYAFHGANPLTFRRWLSEARTAAIAAGPEPLVFVNAWNEWAEGAHLEPDARFGRARLDAVADVQRPVRVRR